MDEATKQQLIAAGREDLIEAHEITVSGYAGVMPHNGMSVDRRKHPEAIPARKNSALGIPEPKELEHSIVFCTCEMPAKVKGKNECWRCKRPFRENRNDR